MKHKDGMNYAPDRKPDPVVKSGEFVFSVVGLEHGHIFGMAGGLVAAGAELKYVYDPDTAKVTAFLKVFPAAKPARSEREVLDDTDTRLVAGACIPGDRCALGLKGYGKRQALFYR
jgi:hypothetical protein